mgnify:CR=1 FL=1|jgi:hypothetical protein
MDENGKPSQSDVNESMGLLADYQASESDINMAKKVIKNATKEQKDAAREYASIPEGMNMGGMVKDELGYMNGGMSYSDRGPVKYSKGGAISGKNFKGSF